MVADLDAKLATTKATLQATQAALEAAQAALATESTVSKSEKNDVGMQTDNGTVMDMWLTRRSRRVSTKGQWLGTEPRCVAARFCRLRFSLTVETHVEHHILQRSISSMQRSRNVIVFARSSEFM
jgi:hypothetical protein